MVKYSLGTGLWKGIKDWGMAIAAGGLTAAFTAAGDVSAQCPDAVITFFGVAITLKAIMQFLNNYRKNK